MKGMGQKRSSTGVGGVGTDICGGYVKIGFFRIQLDGDGESIVCLPARLVIRIQGGEEAAWDAISK